MNKHTPGPWIVVYRAEQDGKGGSSQFSIEANISPAMKKIIAEVGRWGTDENEANARLIAAAPDLLLELESLLGCFWEGRPKIVVKRDCHLMIAVEAARTAIRKAKGE